jgi:hypothetical protein
MVVASTPGVLGNIYVTNPELVALEIAVRIYERCLAQSKRLNLGANKHNTSDILLDNLIIEGSTLVSYIYIFIV